MLNLIVTKDFMKLSANVARLYVAERLGIVDQENIETHRIVRVAPKRGGPCHQIRSKYVMYGLFTTKDMAYLVTVIRNRLARVSSTILHL